MYEFEVLALEYGKLKKEHTELLRLIKKQKKRKAIEILRSIRKLDIEFIQYALTVKCIKNTNINFYEWLKSDYVKRIELIRPEMKLFVKLYDFIFETQRYYEQGYNVTL